ncbi:hypothetical protein BH10ACT8_BH10ACT8_17670 [soil metagenome]
MPRSDSSENNEHSPSGRDASASTDVPFSMRSVAGLRLTLPLVLGVGVCLFAGWFELTRALDGHQIAWVYVFEWPFFAVIGCYMWWRLRTSASEGPSAANEAERPSPGRHTRPRGRAIRTAKASDSVSTDLAEDPELLAWQRYLAKLQADDPPGAPPPR